MKKWLLLAGLAAAAALVTKKLLSMQDQDSPAAVTDVIFDEPQEAAAPVETAAPPLETAAPPAASAAEPPVVLPDIEEE